ncbi:MAG: type II secretion system F family protein [Clostridium sp.]
MANYRYYVITPSGKEKKGIITAADRNQAMSVLKNEGDTVISLDNPNIWNREMEIPFLHPRVKARDMSVFCQQFVTLMNAGISIVRALEMLEEQTGNKVLREALRETRASVEKGGGLASSMKPHDRVFSPMFINLVQAGEEAGKLEVSFERMALHFEKSEKLQNIVKKAVIYPAILSVVALIVVIVMLTYIVPMYAKMFADMNSQLPAYTLFILKLSDFIIHYWYLILIAIFLMVMGVKAFSATETGEYLFADLAIKLPMIGALKRKNACAQFSRNLSTLLGAGVSIIEALEITANTMDNKIYQNAVREAREQVARGIQLSIPLKDSGLFPPMVYHMVGIGEETGGLDEMLNKVADYYEEEVMAATEQAAAAIEPLIIVFMAFIVIGIIAAIFAPMLSMYTNIENL